MVLRRTESCRRLWLRLSSGGSKVARNRVANQYVLNSVEGILSKV
jgi:hypothetical protein